ncbi:MAG: NAD(P)/FAD-dependent oxidoreductase [Chakrabartia sp.]
MHGTGIATSRSIAIIGAGISGLSCASALLAQGHRLTLFDKGRGPGGRMSTRRFETPLGETLADHGAQYFTARDPAFLEEVLRWESAGIATRWPDVSADAWVGLPTMNNIVRHLAQGFDVHWNSRIDGLSRTETGWSVTGVDDDQAEYHAVVLAIPSEQAVTFLAHHDFDMVRKAMLARFQPCWTAIYAFEGILPMALPFLRDRGPIGWAVRELAKPGRSGMERWVVQANASWSAEHLNMPADDVADQLFLALQSELGETLPVPIARSTHRWRFAMSSGLDAGSLWNPSLGLGVCGDWMLGPRIESGWLSGHHLARSIAAARQVVA